MQNLDVIALGGNAILPRGKSGTIHEQFAITRATMTQIVELLVAGRRVVITHGNGPIVGNIVLRNEAMRDEIPPMPLGVCVADSQGGIGYMIQQVLRNALRSRGLDREVVTLVTQVIIDPHDPALGKPTKPIGPFYAKDEAERHARLKGWQMVEDSHRGYRRVVASPRPLDIVEKNVVKRLVDDGVVVITVGGGGVPVMLDGDKLDGVEAVVDKDSATAVLADGMGAERIIIVTDVDAVYRNYGEPDAERIPRMTAQEAIDLADTLPPGSMGAKLRAAAEFAAKEDGRCTVVTRPDDILAALDGKSGTMIGCGP